jgi:hypothetical protein
MKPRANRVRVVRTSLPGASVQRKRLRLQQDRVPLRESAGASPDVRVPDQARVDGKRVLLEGYDEIELRCGKASIILRRNGKVIIRGAEIESHSTGLQRIKGAAVKIN